jgi:TolB-like protein/tetratricopeptide (TPR) repeat protein
MFQFAGHTLDIERRLLKIGNREIDLRPKAFGVLAHLVENADRLVTKDELIKAIWPDVIVTDDSLTHCISEVRNAIGDSRQAIIKTVQRRGYRFAAPVVWLQSDQTPAPAYASVSRLTASAAGSEPPLPDRPSIAVLPFTNMSGNAQQEYFADGVVEEIITALSRFSSIFVIARNSSFAYKGRAVDVKQVGRELGVRYVLEGSVRKAMQRVRITGQLIDAGSGAHLWADSFDGAHKDILELQDQVALSVLGAIVPKMEHAETQRAKRKPIESLGAYDYFLRGMENANQNNREAVSEAQLWFAKAIELDSDFAAAYAMGAHCFILRKASGWMVDREREAAEGARLARKAVHLGKNDAVSLSRAGNALAFLVHQLDAATFCIDRALMLNQNLASAWFSSGWLRVRLNEPDVAINHFARFKRLSPLDPLMPVVRSGTAFAHLFSGRYDDALAEAERALQESPSLHQALRVSAAAYALAGRIERAQEAMARLRWVDPALRISNLEDMATFRRDDLGKFAEGLRIAGLPE